MPLTLPDVLLAFLGQLLASLAVFGLVFALTWRWGAARLAARRLRPRGRPFDGAQLRHELRHTTVVVALATAQLAALPALGAQGLLPAAAGPGPLGTAAGVLALVAFNDLWFYAVHRLLHTRWLFKHVHAVHHRSVDVNPFSSYSFHAVEALLLSGWIVPLALLTPLPVQVVAVTQLVGLANNVMAHLGYELLPAWWLRAPLLRWTNTATFHSLHHQRVHGNYGLFSRVWDRLFGTELEGYAEAFAAAHPPEPQPPAAATGPADPERP
jgi:sterol desaturase/sphingolipid hydroxylase (fatty acid hydroxylase superfamily)